MTFPEKLNALLLVVGLLLVFFGRRVTMISIGVLGFLGGVYFLTAVGGLTFGAPAMILGLVLGIVGALLAFVVHRAAWVFGGFCGGGILLLAFHSSTGLPASIPHAALFVAGGVAGAILFVLILDWALVAVTTLVGAILITQQSGLRDLPGTLLLAALILAGMVVQGRTIRGDSARSRGGD